MRKYAVALMFSIGLTLCGCGSTSQDEMPVTQGEKTSETEPFVDQAEQTLETKIADDSSENTVSTDISQGGPHGEISLSLPDGWRSKEGGTYIHSSESEIDEIALYFSLKNISPTGAALVFNQYDADAPKGELMYGEEYVIEVLKNGEWEEAPIAIEGDYGFHDIAFMLPCEDISEREIDWEWLYGELEPGEYRIGKSVNDFIESGKFEKYMVYAYFVLN